MARPYSPCHSEIGKMARVYITISVRTLLRTYRCLFQGYKLILGDVTNLTLTKSVTWKLGIRGGNPYDIATVVSGDTEREFS
jgi:hypothetical protein